MKNKIKNKSLLLVLAIINIVIIIKLCMNNNEYNWVDNRVSGKFYIPKISEILSLEYQDKLEDIVADQMPKYTWFKLAYPKLSNYVNLASISLFNLDSYGKYIDLGNINLYNDYYLYTPIFDNSTKEKIKYNLNEINDIYINTNTNMYFYFLETDSNYNFEINKKDDSFNYIKQNLDKNIKITSNNLSSFEEYKKAFYKTDHHWNNVGSYNGYLDIAKMMNFKKNVKVKNNICFDNKPSTGSKARSVGSIRYIEDIMCVYDYEMPDFNIFSNGEFVSEYGKSIDKLMNEEEITYASIYGGDPAEIIFENKGEHNKKNLLVYSNSYSNAINKLLAAEYSKTYVVDGRHYKNLNLIEYIKENKIDDVLILGNSYLFTDVIEW